MITISETKSMTKGKVAVYARVSTSGQNTETQIQMANEKLKKNKISDSEVIYYIDNDVSAYRLSVEKRYEFMKLLDDIRCGKISYLIVQARDRLARNFYEHIEIVRFFYKYGVVVEFTDSSQPAFSTDLLTESVHGMLAQNEAMNINSKTKAARDRFPNSKFGFNVFGTKKEKKYEPKPELAKHIQRLYVNVSKLNDAEGLLTLMIENKKQLANPKKFFDCLTNPFYAGQIYIEGSYSPLNHVEPIVSMDLFLKVQEKLAELDKGIEILIARITEIGVLHPICHICKKHMVIRLNKDLSNYYVCSNKHSKISIDTADFNKLVSKEIESIVKSIDSERLKVDVFKQLYVREKEVKYNLQVVEKHIKNINKRVLDLIGTKSNEFTNALSELNSYNERLLELNTILNRIQQVRKEISTFAKKLKKVFVDELLKYHKSYLIKQLVSSIEVMPDALIYRINFSQYIVGDEANNDVESAVFL